MSYPTNFKINSPPKERVLGIDFFKGLQLSVNNTQIDSNASPDMLNMLLDDKGTLNKRTGLRRIVETLGEGPITGIFSYQQDLLYGHGTKLYVLEDADTVMRYNLGAFNLTEDFSDNLVFDGFSGNPIQATHFNGKMYILDGVNFYVYDGEEVKEVVGYIPVVVINTPPEGGGTPFEQLNLLSSGFRQRFSPPGSTTVFKLAFDDLDITEVKVDVEGVIKVEGIDFTVNRETGTVTLNSPAGQGIDTVEITAYKTFEGQADKIKKCRFFGSFGGTRDFRMFVAGNPDTPNIDYRSELYDPTYFPVNGTDEIGTDDDPIMGYSYMYQFMIIFKRKSIFKRAYHTTSDGVAVFETDAVNRGIGTINTNSIALIEGIPTFLSKDGVYQLVNVSYENERTVLHISNDVDKNIDFLAINGILQSGNYEDNIAADYDSKYWLVNPKTGEVWVYDYRFKFEDEPNKPAIGQWFRLDNMYGSCIHIHKNRLYIGDSRLGRLEVLKDESDESVYIDNHTPINAYWRSKVFDFDAPSYEKLVYKLFYTLKPYITSEADLYIRDSNNAEWRFITTELMQLFAYSIVQYSSFTYSANFFPRRVAEKVKTKKISYFQMELRNDKPQSFIGIIQVALNYILQREVK